MGAPVWQFTTVTATAQVPLMVCSSCADKDVCQAARVNARIVQIRKMLFVISISFSADLGGEPNGPEMLWTALVHLPSHL
jgi:hypothetical protein